MKKMNKVITAIMIMAVTAMPAIAGNSMDKEIRPTKKEMRMEKRRYDRIIDKRHYRHHAAAIEMTTFKVSHRAARHKNVVAAAMSVYGVKDVKWNPRSGMMTVIYDANKTTARRIKAVVR